MKTENGLYKTISTTVKTVLSSISGGKGLPDIAIFWTS
jgi:hypothetical protein